MVLDIIFKSSKFLGQDDTCVQPEAKAQELADGIAASIPYHLTDDVAVYAQRIHSGLDTNYDGKPVGGLQLLHPLWVVANASVVSQELRTHMRKHLAWIGQFSRPLSSFLYSCPPPYSFPPSFLWELYTFALSMPPLVLHCYPLGKMQVLIIRSLSGYWAGQSTCKCELVNISSKQKKEN